MPRSSLRLGLVVAAIVLAGCGDDDDAAPPSDGGAGAPDAVEVIARDIAFDRDRYEATAGEVSFRYVNEGNILHTFVIDDVGGLELMVRSAGDVDEGSIELDAGEYEVFCDIPGHRQAGMVATLEVS